MSIERYQYYKEDLISGHFRKYSSGDYADRNNRLIEMIKGYDFKTVVEVAGAEADMADKILREFPYIASYSWSDLVAEAVDNANKRIPNLCFNAYQLDLDTDSPPLADLFISTALEHTFNYREVIEELPPGTLVLLSLPNFHDPGHRIHFPQFTDIIEVYGDMLRFLKVEVWLYDRGITGTFITLIKKCLKCLGLLSWLIKRGVFRSGCGRESDYYKWLILAIRNGDKNE